MLEGNRAGVSTSKGREPAPIPGQCPLMAVPSIYRAVVAEIERRRIEIGWTCLELDNAAGLSSGYWAKCVHADEPSGRRIRWEMLEFVVGALFPDGYKLEVEGEIGPMLTAMSMRFHVKAAAKPGTPTHREHMRYLSKMATDARKEITPARRKRIARRAAKMRWKQQKFKHAPTIG